MREDRFKKPEKELIFPIKFPDLTRQPRCIKQDKEKLKYKSIYDSIGMVSLKFDKNKDESLFKLLFTSCNPEAAHKRSVYLKEMVISNPNYFPHELKLDKLVKRQPNKKSLKDLLKDNKLLAKKRKNDGKQPIVVENENKAKIPSNENKSNEKKSAITEFEELYKKDSLYYERHRRDSLDMAEFRIDGFAQKLNPKKIVQEDESVVGEEKSEEESLNDEYNEESEGEQFGSDEGGYDGANSDY